MTASRVLSRRGCKDSMRNEGVEVRGSKLLSKGARERKGKQRPVGGLLSRFLMICRFRKFLVRK